MYNGVAVAVFFENNVTLHPVDAYDKSDAMIESGHYRLTMSLNESGRQENVVAQQGMSDRFSVNFGFTFENDVRSTGFGLFQTV